MSYLSNALLAGGATAVLTVPLCVAALVAAVANAWTGRPPTRRFAVAALATASASSLFGACFDLRLMLDWELATSRSTDLLLVTIYELCAYLTLPLGSAVAVGLALCIGIARFDRSPRPVPD